jgi:hypothetical protein
MPYLAKTYNVFIASPGDVAEERAILREVIMNWNYLHSMSKRIILLPVGWETHSMPIQGDRPQGLINDYILKDCDILVGVIWSRIGSPTGKSISGTVEEIDEFIDSGKPTLLYKSNRPISPDSLDPRQYAEVDKFVKEKMTAGLLQFYNTTDEFKEYLQSQLNILVNSHPIFKEEILGEEQDGDDYDDLYEMSEVAHKIFMQVGLDSKGELNLPNNGNTRSIETNGQVLFSADRNDPRENAEYERIKDEIAFERGFINSLHKTKDGEVWKINAEGFEYFDRYNS